MKRAPLLIGLAAVIGLAGGWLLFGRAETAKAPPAPAPTQRPDQPATSVISPAELDQVKAQVAQLERKQAIEKMVANKQGAPIPTPDNLDPRFSSERIRLAVNAAFKQAGLDGEATSVDCSEYPCMAMGEIKGTSFGREQTTKVTGLLRKMGYPDDTATGFGASVKENGAQRYVFGLALYPKTEGQPLVQINERLHHRFDASQGIK